MVDNINNSNTVIKECLSCKQAYYYDLEECIFCFNALRKREIGKLKILNFTTVTIPTPSHQDVPYFVVLAEDAEGNLFLKKSHSLPQEGGFIDFFEKEFKKENASDDGVKKNLNPQNLLFPSS